MMIQEQFFQTKDYHLAAALVAAGQKMQRLRWRGTIAFFIFDQPDTCYRLNRQYRTNELMVKALDYALAIKELKLKLYSERVPNG